MQKPTHPENALVDFQYETAPLVYLAQTLENSREATEELRVLCQALQLVHERADKALHKALEWVKVGPHHICDTPPQECPRGDEPG